MTDTETQAAAESQGSAFSQLFNLFVSPGQALDYADRHPGTWWLPLGVTLLLNAILGVWVALTININALHAMMIAAIRKSNPEHAQQAIQMISSHGRAYILIGVIFGLIFLAVIELIYALYLFLADKLVSANSRGYGRWFSFTTWTWLPLTLTYIAGIVTWAFVGHNGGFNQTNITSLNSLLFHFHQGSPFYKVAQFSILQFWVIGLVTYGLKRWCRHGTAKALAITLLPYIVVYGILYLV